MLSVSIRFTNANVKFASNAHGVIKNSFLNKKGFGKLVDNLVKKVNLLLSTKPIFSNTKKKQTDK